jgi:surfactin synthase thioesterase subunit
MDSINLVCLPFAGGNKYSYRCFEKIAPSFLTITTLEYPGRGSRSKEPLMRDIDSLAHDLFGQLKEIIKDGNYAFYGHSMGGLLACLVTRKVLDNNFFPPGHLFITGTTGPSAHSRSEKKTSLMDKEEFIQELIRLKGGPDEILQNRELLDYFEPILRADFEVSESYLYDEVAPMNIPITVITGMEEDMEEADIRSWQKETNFAIDFKRLPGHHFFILDFPEVIIDVIMKKLIEV